MASLGQSANPQKTAVFWEGGMRTAISEVDAAELQQALNEWAKIRAASWNVTAVVEDLLGVDPDEALAILNECNTVQQALDRNGMEVYPAMPGEFGGGPISAS